jgi:tRNA(adenine34) deaminase
MCCPAPVDRRRCADVHGIRGLWDQTEETVGWSDMLETAHTFATLPMQRALDEARAAAARGEVPVGCVIVGPGGAVIASGGNETRANHDPSAHAEIVALRRAGAALQSDRLIECDLYVTLEPCPMCATAISFARIRRVYFGAYDPKGGGVEHGARIFNQPTCHHVPEVYGGLSETEAQVLLRSFFAERR